MKKEITVSGFKVIVEEDKEYGVFVLSCPELPGCIGQVKKEEDAPREMERLILAHLSELGRKKLKPRPYQDVAAPAGKKGQTNKKGLN